MRSRAATRAALDWVMAPQAPDACRVPRHGGATVVLYVLMPTGFFPQQDTAFFNGSLQTSQDASFAKTGEKIQEVGRIIAEDPDVTEAHFNLGSSAVNQSGFNAALAIPRPRVATPRSIR